MTISPGRITRENLAAAGLERVQNLALRELRQERLMPRRREHLQHMISLKDPGPFRGLEARRNRDAVNFPEPAHQAASGLAFLRCRDTHALGPSLR
jgi:hypothetical protein